MAIAAPVPFIVSGPPGWVVGGLILLGAGAYGTYRYFNSPSETTAESAPSTAAPSATANDKADTKLKDATIAEVCTTCPAPCAHLACGVPGSTYRGGAHGCMKKPTGDTKDSHHMPADSISTLPRDSGPSIQMDPRDHRRTNSYGASAGTNAVLAGQQRMIAGGNFLGAQAIDVAEVAAKFPGKYDAAILQMEAYTACLKQHGFVR